MSVKTYTDSTTRIITKTIEEHVWKIRRDAIGCNNSLEFRENQDTGDITADGDYTGDMDNEWLNIHDTNTAIQTALQHGWQEGNRRISRPGNRTESHRRNAKKGNGRMSDYKQRMIREHRELQERIGKLAHMLEGYAEGTLDFTPACSFQLLESQLYAMGAYANILQERARIEQVDLNAPLEGGESGEVSQD